MNSNAACVIPFSPRAFHSPHHVGTIIALFACILWIISRIIDPMHVASNATQEGGVHYMRQKGFFIIRPYDEKTILTLKGNFDRTNTLWIKKAMLAGKAMNTNRLELDMLEVDAIDMKAMALISIALKTLKENGIATRVTGLDEKKRALAHSLGMHYITQIHYDEK